MQESNDLKAGDKTTYVVAGENLFIEPRPYGVLCDIVGLVFGSITDIGKMEAGGIIAQLPSIIKTKLPQIFALAFDRRRHPFLNEEWMSNNLTFIDIQKIIERFIKVNNLEDFLEKMFPEIKRKKEAQVRELQETQGK